MLLADPESLYWFRAEFSKKDDTTFRGVLGPYQVRGEVTDIMVLNRVVRRGPEGIEHEADPRHAEIIIHELGLQG